MVTTAWCKRVRGQPTRLKPRRGNLQQIELCTTVEYIYQY